MPTSITNSSNSNSNCNSAERRFVEAYNAVARDGAWPTTPLPQAAARGASAPPPVPGVQYRRTWPDGRLLDTLDDLHARYPRGACGWLDSTLDLRQGLSVIEVYADADPAATPPFVFEPMLSAALA